MHGEKASRNRVKGRILARASDDCFGDQAVGPQTGLLWRPSSWAWLIVITGPDFMASQRAWPLPLQLGCHRCWASAMGLGHYSNRSDQDKQNKNDEVKYLR